MRRKRISKRKISLLVFVTKMFEIHKFLSSKFQIAMTNILENVFACSWTKFLCLVQVLIFLFQVSVFWLTAFCGIVPFVFAAFMLVLPETPYYHMLKRKFPQAQNSLAWFRGQHYDGKTELEVIQKSIDDVRAENLKIICSLRSLSSFIFPLLLSNKISFHDIWVSQNHHCFVGIT